MIPLESNDLLGLVEKFAASGVLEAISQNRISLELAQLLAVLSKEKQTEAIHAIQTLDYAVGIDELRASIESKALRLEDLPASQKREAACKSCIHNSLLSSKVFPIHIAPGLCTNGDCNLIKDCKSGAVNGNRKTEKSLSPARTKSIDDTREKLWRNGLKRFVLEADRGLNRVLLLCMLAGGWKTTSDFGESVFKCKVSPAKALEMANAMEDPAVLTEGLQEIAVNLVDEAPLEQVRELLKALQVPLGRYFPMQKTFLEQLDQAGISRIAKELGVVEGEEIKQAGQTGLKEYALAVANSIPDECLIDYFPPEFRP